MIGFVLVNHLRVIVPMKIVRIICLCIAWLWAAFMGLVAVLNFHDIPGGDLGYVIGTLIGYGIFLVPSFVLFFIARKIRRKLDRAKREALINSFETI